MAMQYGSGNYNWEEAWVGKITYCLGYAQPLLGKSRGPLTAYSEDEGLPLVGNDDLHIIVQIFLAVGKEL